MIQNEIINYSIFEIQKNRDGKIKLLSNMEEQINWKYENIFENIIKIFISLKFKNRSKKFWTITKKIHMESKSLTAYLIVFTILYNK